VARRLKYATGHSNRRVIKGSGNQRRSVANAEVATKSVPVSSYFSHAKLLFPALKVTNYRSDGPNRQNGHRLCNTAFGG
jgi:hypothetical protein